MRRYQYIKVYHLTDETHPVCSACGYPFDLSDNVYQPNWPGAPWALYCSMPCATAQSGHEVQHDYA